MFLLNRESGSEKMFADPTCEGCDGADENG
jgi:hypothetical protein